MNFILFDGPSRSHLLPFTYTRPVAEIRVGILTLREKWEKYLKQSTSTKTEDYLSLKFPLVKSKNNILINASYLPNYQLSENIKKLKENQVLVKSKNVIAYCSSTPQKKLDIDSYEVIEYPNDITRIEHTWDIFSKNEMAIQEDYKLITQDRSSQPIESTNTVIGAESLFIEEGAKVKCATLNASKGPIYIGKNAEIMEGSLIRGPFALGEGATLKLGAKIYGATTIGPYSKVGGEVNNSVIFGFSNKGHDGFLGNSVIGEWCNLGADTNTSNLKNNYAEVRLWNYPTEGFAKTGLQFCGLMMGDHSKSSINTMFNTGTVVGVCANIFGSGFPRNFVPSFSWGGNNGFAEYVTKKAFEVAKVVMQRRGKEFNQQDTQILEAVFENSKRFRGNFK